MAIKRPNVISDEPKKQLGIRPKPTVWGLHKARPILDRLPIESGAYKKGGEDQSHPEPFVLNTDEYGPARCRVGYRNSGKILVVGGGVVVWTGGSTVLEGVEVKVGLIGELRSGVFKVGYRLDGEGDGLTPHFITHVDEEITFHHIVLGQITTRNGRVISVVDLRVFTDDRHDPVALWVSDAQDSATSALLGTVRDYGKRHMAPLEAGKDVYVELGLTEDEVEDYEHRGIVPQRLTPQQIKRLEDVYRALNWVGQLVGFNDSSLLSLHSSPLEKRYMVAGAFGLYRHGADYKHLVPDDPTRYDVDFRVAIESNRVVLFCPHTEIRYGNIVRMFVGGKYSFSSPVRVEGLASSSFVLGEDGKSVRVKEAQGDKVGLLYLDNRDSSHEPCSVLFVKRNLEKYEVRWAKTKGLGVWGSKGSSVSMHYCFDSLGVGGFDERGGGIDFEPHTYEVTPKELVESLGLKCTDYTDREAEAFRFEVNGSVGESVRESSDRKVCLLETSDIDKHGASKNVCVYQELEEPYYKDHKAFRTKRFKIDYGFVEDQTLLNPNPKVRWVMPSEFDNGPYEPDDYGERKSITRAWVEIDEGELGEISNSPTTGKMPYKPITLDEGYLDQVVPHPYCEADRHIRRLDGGEMGQKDHVTEGVDGGFFGQDIDIPHTTHVVGEVLDYEQRFDYDEGDIDEDYGYPAILRSTRSDNSPLQWYVIEDDDNHGVSVGLSSGATVIHSINHDDPEYPSVRFDINPVDLGTLQPIQWDFVNVPLGPNVVYLDLLCADVSPAQPRLKIRPKGVEPESLWAVDIVELEVVCVRYGDGKRCVKRAFKENSGVDLRKFTEVDFYSPVVKVDEGELEFGENREVSSTLDEGRYTGLLQIGVPYVDASKPRDIPKPCVTEPIKVDIPAFEGIKWRFNPSTEQGNTPAGVWNLAPSEAHSGVGDERVRQSSLVADLNHGTQDIHSPNHFVRLSPSHSRTSLQWDKAARVGALFSSSSVQGKSGEEERGEKILPSLYCKVSKFLRTSHVVYDESYLCSDVGIVPQGLTEEYGEGCVVYRGEDPKEVWDNAEIVSYDPYVQREKTKNPNTQEYIGTYYQTHPDVSLSGNVREDTEKNKIKKLSGAPIWEKPDALRVRDGALKQLGHKVCYAYFSADLSAAEDAVFDPYNPLCWATNILTRQKSAYVNHE